MNTKSLSPRSLSIIDQYINFKIGNAICSIPYFNNKTIKARGALGVYVGKGSPKEISEETESLLIKNHSVKSSLTNQTLKKLLVDNNIGIDCSGFAYYILNSESEERKSGSLEKNLSLVQVSGFFRKILASLHPVKNIGVLTFADDKNSCVIPITDISPGDIITMLGKYDSDLSYADNDRNHILIIHKVDYQDSIPYKIYYSHAVSYPEHGLYGSGIKQGTIEITNTEKPITEQVWIENEKQGEQNNIFVRSTRSKTEVRRLKSYKN